jgi:hypothetical protein
LSPSSDQGDKLVGLVTSGYVLKIGLFKVCFRSPTDISEFLAVRHDDVV